VPHVSRSSRRGKSANAKILKGEPPVLESHSLGLGVRISFQGAGRCKRSRDLLTPRKRQCGGRNAETDRWSGPRSFILALSKCPSLRKERERLGHPSFISLDET
jgi:hypothetical protein